MNFMIAKQHTTKTHEKHTKLVIMNKKYEKTVKKLWINAKISCIINTQVVEIGY